MISLYMESTVLPSQWTVLTAVFLSVAAFVEGRWNLANRNWPGSFIIFFALTVITFAAGAAGYFQMWFALGLSILVLVGELVLTVRYPPEQ
jgi:hypothetical protein